MKQLLYAFYDQIIQSNSALYHLQRYEEALVAYDEAIRLQPDFGQAYFSRGKTLERLAQELYQKYEQLAQSSNERARQLGVE